MKFIGIDVGKDGGIACIDEKSMLTYFRMPKIGKLADLHSIYAILTKLTEAGDSVIGMEDVSSIPGASAGSNFVFGENKGHLEGILVGLGVSYQKVSPKAWQKVCWEGVPIMKNVKGKNDTKAISLVAAKRLLPGYDFLASERSTKPHDGCVDASLIAKYMQIKYSDRSS